MGLPVAGIPANSPRCVPENVHLHTARSPSTMTSRTVMRTSGNALFRYWIRPHGSPAIRGTCSMNPSPRSFATSAWPSSLKPLSIIRSTAEIATWTSSSVEGPTPRFMDGYCTSIGPSASRISGYAPRRMGAVDVTLVAGELVIGLGGTISDDDVVDAIRQAVQGYPTARDIDRIVLEM